MPTLAAEPGLFCRGVSCGRNFVVWRDCTCGGRPRARYVSPRSASPLLPRLSCQMRGSRKRPPTDRSDSLICLKKIGAGEGIRTLDPDLGKVVLYP